MSIIVRLLKNQLLLKPRAAPARRAVREFLTSHGYVPKSVESTLGLADASKLRIVVIFETDAELSRLASSGEEAEVEGVARQALEIAAYPMAELRTIVSFHSHETIVRSGGYHNYFQ
jgi:hypothetical protein